MAATTTRTADNVLKSRQVSTMIKQGFISDQTLSFSPSRNPTTLSKLYHSPISSPSKTVNSSSSSSSSPPPPPQPQPTESTHSTQTLSTESTHSTRTESTRATLFEMMSEEHVRGPKPMKTTSENHGLGVFYVVRLLLLWPCGDGEREEVCVDSDGDGDGGEVVLGGGGGDDRGAKMVFGGSGGGGGE